MKNEEKKIKIVYAEPLDYFSKETRKKYKLGEFAEPEVKTVKKVIELEVDFPDGFTPPEEFDMPTSKNHWKSACASCPFFFWPTELPYAHCDLLGKEPKTNACPIKKYFI